MRRVTRSQRSRVISGNAALLEVLPLDMVQAIVVNIHEARSLCNLATTCSVMRQAISDADGAWQQVTLARFPRVGQILNVLNPTSFREIYMSQLAAERSDASAISARTCCWEDFVFTFELFQWYPALPDERGRHLFTRSSRMMFDYDDNYHFAQLWQPFEDEDEDEQRRMPDGVDGIWGFKNQTMVQDVPCVHLVIYATQTNFHSLKLYEGKPDDDDDYNVFYEYGSAPSIEGQQAICKTISPWCMTEEGKMAIRFFREAPFETDDHYELNEQEALNFMANLLWQKTSG